jgi:hypothetical protein
MSVARKLVNLVVVGLICIPMSPAAETEMPDGSSDTLLTIAITALDVNDSTFTLSYDVKNESDHEAWVCSEPGPPFEMFLALDNQTLVIRKRMDVPAGNLWDRGVPMGTYVRIVPGDSLKQSVCIPLPATSKITYSAKETIEVTQIVNKVTLEVGCYDEDLPSLVHSICAIADTCNIPSGSISLETLNTYFRGVAIREGLGRYFDRVNPDPYGKGQVRIWYSQHGLVEKILRADVNDVVIPYTGRAVLKYGE